MKRGKRKSHIASFSIKLQADGKKGVISKKDAAKCSLVSKPCKSAGPKKHLC